MMNSNAKHSILAGLYGNALEWYDFLLYASFAPLFAQIFFPTQIPFLSLLATFSLFAIGFIMRPIGGLLLGHYADHIGRRKALIASMTVMTVTTTLIAFLPDYHTLGVLAPVLFSILRLVQGLAVGGELPGSTTYLIEHMFEKRRGLAGSLVLSSAFLGIFAGALTAALFSSLFTGDALLKWGWRFTYLIGGVLGVFGIYLRLKSCESPAYLKGEKTEEVPVVIIFTQYRQPLFLAAMITSIMALANYLLIAYVTTYLVRYDHFLLHDALTINLLALALLTVLIPCMGYLSDILGRKPVYLLGLFSLLLLIFPFFMLLTSLNWWYILWGQLLLALVLAPLNATVPTIIAEMFPTSIRASGISMGYNIGQALFGGTMPLIAFSLIEVTGDRLAPAWYLVFWTLVVIGISFRMTESYKKVLV